MFKKIILILTLLSLITITAFGLTGELSPNSFFYKPGYGEFGEAAYNQYNTYIDVADAAIEANKDAFGSYYLKTAIDTLGECETIWSKDVTDSTELATALGDYYLKTAIDTQGEVETIWGVLLVNDGDLGSYYLKTSIDTLSEVETIWSKDVTDSTELATALTDYYLKTAIDTQGEVETIWGDTVMNDLVDDTAPELGGELDSGAHSIGFTQQTITYNSATTTVDWKLGNKAVMTFGAGNITTFAFTNPTNPCNVLIKIIQDGTGSRVVTGWDADIKWAGGGTAPTLTTTASGIDIVSFYWDGSNYFGLPSLDFS